MDRGGGGGTPKMGREVHSMKGDLLDGYTYRNDAFIKWVRR